MTMEVPGAHAQDSAPAARVARPGYARSVHLCRYPYPYQSMLAICSDLDETPDRHVYWEIMRFLNTEEATSMGPGVGLEVGNSIYFDMPPEQFAYWNTDDAGREMVRTLIRSGHIDCLHSYGDLAATRQHAARALDELAKYGCKLDVWVDHRKSPTNFGHDITAGVGDVVGSPAYHADISTAFGIKYVWRGRTTGVLGQNGSGHLASYASMLRLRHPVISSRTMAKEVVKAILGRGGHPRWEMHARNCVLRPSRLRDGNRIWEFLRADPYFGGQSAVDTGELIGRVLTRQNLNLLVRRGAVWIHYTHLGKGKDPIAPLSEEARWALRLLARYNAEGQVLVTTTARLLRYLIMRDHVQCHAEDENGVVVLTIETIDDPIRGRYSPAMEELQGLTFLGDGAKAIRIQLAGKNINISHRLARNNGKTYAYIPWQRLVFPSL